MSVYGFSQCQSRSGCLMQDISSSTNVAAQPAFTEGVGGNGEVTGVWTHYMWDHKGIKRLPVCVLLSSTCLQGLLGYATSQAALAALYQAPSSS